MIPGYSIDLLALAVLIAATIPCLAGEAVYVVRFSEASYAVQPLATQTVQVVIDPVPASGLFSFGLKLAFDSSRLRMRSTSSIHVPPELDNNGVDGPGALKETGDGFAAVKGTVNFFTSPQKYYFGSALASFDVENTELCFTSITLAFYRTAGPSENLFLDGNKQTLDSHIHFQPDPFQTVVDPVPKIAITKINTRVGPKAQLTYSINPSFNYVVEAADAFERGAIWSPLPSPPHNSGTMYDAISGRRFYRLKVSIQPPAPTTP